MKIETTYKCEICGAIYSTPEEASNCEDMHKKCYCEKCKVLPLTSAVISWGRSIESCVDFRKKEIRVYLYDDCCSTCKEEVPIKFCPFCGKEL